MDMQPRGKLWPASAQLDVPRDQTGTGEYMRLLSEVRPTAVWLGAHRAVSKPSHWAVSPSAAALRVHRIKIRQHYETPAAVVATVRRLWAPDYDAMASPINAVCEDYCTLEDDFDAPLFDRRIFVNPAYDTEGLQHHESNTDIASALDKLIRDVRERGCTLMALLPALVGNEWYERYVDTAHEVHLISGKVYMPNPYFDLPAHKPWKSALWRVRGYVLAVWRPGLVPSQPKYQRLTLDVIPDDHVSAHLRFRKCCICGCVRVLPRYAEECASQDAFECRMSPDCKYNWCAAPEWVPRFEK